jgi:tetratricopeptide (TPR) repeat protein
VNAAVGERASDLLRLAEADPRRSVQLATAMLRAARRDGDLATASVASRALGLAALHLQDPDAAIRHLRSAADLGTRAGSRPLAADARMRLAFALNVRGRPRQAVREIDAVLDDIDGPGRARALAQRGAIMHQLGRWDEALASYRIALPVLRQAADDVWVKRVLSNRGVLYGQRHEFGAAEADLAEAEEVCRRLDQDLTLAFIHQNLGWVCSQRGDVPRALAYLDQAERRLRSLRSQLGWVLADRGELLLSVGLVREAKEATAQAVRAFERERREIALPEIRLLLARTASVGGDPAGAYEQARRAVREFTRQQRPEWAALARFAVLSARLAGAPGPRVTLGAVERSADGLAAAGWRAEALDARILAGRIALARGSTSRGCGHLRQASRGRRSGPAAMRARGWHAEILLRLANDDRRGADRAIRAALRLIDEHRATFGATDLRAHASGQRVEIAELGLRMALADGRPERVLAATERGRASHLLMPPVRPPDDPALASDLTDLRATVAELGKARGAAGPAAGTSRLARRQLSLERRIRDHTRRHAGPAHAGAIGSVPARELAESLGERVLVEFVRLDEALHAVTVDRGRIRLHGLGPWEPIGHLVDRIPFALRLLARPGTSPSGRAAAVTLLRDAGRRLDAALLAPLARQVGDRALVVVPTEPLHSLPWSTLPSCAGRAVTVVPSAALWVAAQGPRRAGHVAVVAGPNLSGAHAEAVAVAAIHATEALTGPAATVAATMAALDGARLAHLATHGSVHPDNPLFSALMLADGPLTAYDLERLPRLPQVVILASCDSGRLVVRAGDELLGLAATLLSHGARQIVASVVPVPDVETASLMVELHRSLAAGTPPAAALATVQANALDDAGPAAAAAAGFVCLGG